MLKACNNILHNLFEDTYLNYELHKEHHLFDYCHALLVSYIVNIQPNVHSVYNRTYINCAVL
jgi:hypothetical protein